MSDLQRRIAELSPAKRRLLELRLQAAGQREAGSPRAMSAPVGDIPLSCPQEDVWLASRVGPASVHNVPVLHARLTGTLDEDALVRALTEIVRRHEALRTTFETRGEKVVQVIAPHVALPLASVDMRWMTHAEREQAVTAIAQAEGQQPFDLARGPLLRVRLLRLGKSEHVLLVTAHHIVVDGWSIAILLRELSALYNSFRSGAPSPLAHPKVRYGEYACWQRASLQGPKFEASVEHWRRRLAGMPALELAYERAHTGERRFRGAHRFVDLPRPLIDALKAFGRAEGATLLMVLLAAFKVLLARWSEQRDLSVGLPISRRDRAELDDVIGLFASQLVIRTDLSGDPSFREILARVRSVALEAYAHQEVAFTTLVEVSKATRRRGQTFLQVVFDFISRSVDHRISLHGLETTSLLGDDWFSDFLGIDLFLLVLERAEGARGVLGYNAELFDAATIDRLITDYVGILETGVREPDTPLARFHTQAPARTGGAAIVVASTFTAEPLRDFLTFWLNELNLPLQVQLAPYNQVFQQLLDPASALSLNRQGINVLLLRSDDCQSSGIQELRRAIDSAATRSGAPLLVCLCPPHAERLAPLAANGLSLNVWLIGAEEVITEYGVAQPFDAEAERLGDLPFSSPFFAALATAIARRVYGLRSRSFKVIAVDGDQTLWNGVCGEDGAAGVSLDAGRRMLQEMLVAQRAAGMLLCLCSRNHADDVRAVFEQGCEMPLRWDHFAARRIDWASKSAQLASLAQELQIDLDRFVFIDDDAVECEEVRSSCPEVQTVLLPSSPTDIASLLRHIWAFDHLRTTAEDRNRATAYDQNARRRLARAEFRELDRFLENLALNVVVSPARSEHLPRIAQLTQRTTQFNATTRSFTEAELRDWLAVGHEAFVVEVSDRFGDYGLVGVIGFGKSADALHVDLFLLSCRALGRGVEHRMLRYLGETASARGASWISVAFTPTDRNRPVKQFLAHWCQAEDHAQSRFVISASAASGVVYRPAEEIGIPIESSDGHGESETAQPVQSRTLERITGEWRHADRILAAVREQRRRPRPVLPVAFVAPRSAAETTLAGLWSELLHVTPIGVHDDFFQLGGTSMLVIQLIAAMRRTFDRDILPSAVMEAPTIARLAERLDQARPTDGDCLVALQREGNRPPVFAIHGLDGEILPYHKIARYLGPDQPFYALRARGLSDPQRLHRSVEEMAADYLAMMRSADSRGPSVVVGWSFGGLVAYEVAVQRERAGEPAPLVALIDSFGPAANADRGLFDDPSTSFVRLLEGLGGLVSRDAQQLRESLRATTPEQQRQLVRGYLDEDLRITLLPYLVGRGAVAPSDVGMMYEQLGGREPDAQLALCVDLVRRLPFIGDSFDLRTLRREVDVHRANLQAMFGYVPGKLGGRIVLFAASDPLSESLEGAYAARVRAWQECAGRELDVHIIGGNHYSILEEPHVRSLADALKDCIRGAAAEYGNDKSGDEL